MMKNLQKILIVCLLAMLASRVFGVDDDAESRLKQTLEASLAGMVVESIKPAGVDALYEVRFRNGPTIVAHESGSYFFVGDLFSVLESGVVNLTEMRRNGERAKLMASVKDSDTTIFMPEGEVKAVISVFTDTTCYYCRKLHAEVPRLNELGVEVRYLAYPRYGLNPADKNRRGLDELVSTWCSDDRADTLTAYKNNESRALKTCASTLVTEQFNLGRAVGVNGTPAIVLDSGELIPGYKTADQLAEILGITEE
ncbi:DsbC family protein [Aequoribacter sp.]|jgi:thiol:disulfide interchange protein DsbC|uniref:DsbC family protein n=1 Tax=Aequoribacter sp. TaxID=2847771 RepID=UPI003C3740C8